MKTEAWTIDRMCTGIRVLGTRSRFVHFDGRHSRRRFCLQLLFYAVVVVVFEFASEDKSLVVPQHPENDPELEHCGLSKKYSGVIHSTFPASSLTPYELGRPTLVIVFPPVLVYAQSNYYRSYFFPLFPRFKIVTGDER